MSDKLDSGLIPLKKKHSKSQLPNIKLKHDSIKKLKDLKDLRELKDNIFSSTTAEEKQEKVNNYN